ncbi:MAG: hypothetical protein IJQ41_06345 [Firmicutes bacterium]|nr:hypothetical protein [Clostridia bacterium]MBR0210347.1 hypothetical protein [Bacillota bacterium]
MKIKQGDAYDVYITLTDDDGEQISVNGGDAEMVEVMLGRLRKTCPGDITEMPRQVWSGDGTVEEKDVMIGDKDYGIVTVISGDGISDVFSEGDIISIEYADPTQAPYVKTMTNLHVWNSYYNEDTGVDFIIPEQVPFGDYTFEQEMTIKGLHSGEYVMPLTQQETFALGGVLPFEARVKFADQAVVGTTLGVVRVDESMSREVL